MADELPDYLSVLEDVGAIKQWVEKQLVETSDALEGFRRVTQQAEAVFDELKETVALLEQGAQELIDATIQRGEAELGLDID